MGLHLPTRLLEKTPYAAVSAAEFWRSVARYNAGGQLPAVIADHRKKLYAVPQLGPNIAPSLEFPISAPGGSFSNAILSFVNGELVLTGSGTFSFPLISLSVNHVPGKLYKLEVTMRRGTSVNPAAITVQIPSPNANYTGVLNNSTQVNTTQSMYFTAPQGVLNIVFFQNNSTGDNGTVILNSVTIKEVLLGDVGSELVNDANWQMVTSPGAGSAVATNSPQGTLTVGGDGTNTGYATYSFTTVVGQTYTLAANVSANAVAVAVGTVQFGAQIVPTQIWPLGTSSLLSFVATSTTTWVSFNRSATGTAAVVRSVSLRSWTANPILRPATFNEVYNYTATGTTSRYYKDAAGNWKNDLLSNVPRYTYENGYCQLALNDASTNSVPNPSMSGASVAADGVELLVNTGFDATGTGWTVAGAVTFSGGNALMSGNNSSWTGTAVSQQVTGLIPGRNYVIMVTGSPNAFRAGVGNSAFDTAVLTFGQDLVPGGFGNPASDRVGFTATATSHWITIGRFSTVQATLSTVSVKDGERVQNGGFTSNPISASQNTASNGWQWSLNAGTGGTAVWNGVDGVTITGDGTNLIRFTQSIPTVAGCSYTLTATTSSSCSYAIGTVANGSQIASGGFTGQTVQFVATGSTTWITFYKATAIGSLIKNVSVQSIGALPTGWSWINNGTNGITGVVAEVGTEFGLPYIGIRWSGTSTAAQNVQILPTNSTSIVAVQNQTWTGSMFVRIVQGTKPGNTSLNLSVIQRGAAGAYINENGGAMSVDDTFRRFNYSKLMSDPSVTAAQIYTYFAFQSAGTVVDFTVRYYCPQLESKDYASAPIAVGSGTAINRTIETCEHSLFVEAILSKALGKSATVRGSITNIGSSATILGGAATVCLIGQQSGNGTVISEFNGSSAIQVTLGSGNFTTGAGACVAGDAGGRAISGNGAVATTDTSNVGDLSVSYLGRRGTVSATSKYGDGFYDEEVIYASRLPVTQVQTQAVAYG